MALHLSVSLPPRLRGPPSLTFPSARATRLALARIRALTVSPIQERHLCRYPLFFVLFHLHVQQLDVQALGAVISIRCRRFQIQLLASSLLRVARCLAHVHHLCYQCSQLVPCLTLALVGTAIRGLSLAPTLLLVGGGVATWCPVVDQPHDPTLDCP